MIDKDLLDKRQQMASAFRKTHRTLVLDPGKPGQSNFDTVAAQLGVE
jgi:hypothetical protein